MVAYQPKLKEPNSKSRISCLYKYIAQVFKFKSVKYFCSFIIYQVKIVSWTTKLLKMSDHLCN